MQIFLVGGAVRDKLMNYPVGDCDWVVVGASPEQMLDLGYNPVGKDFPVFLHPKSQEEYALARTERKTAPGYSGFQFHCAPDITLEQDLIRRDLTINAIAEDYDGNLVDPYNGQQDILDKKLRHVSDAFAEDPVRILRVARFAARYHHLGFTIADETMALMASMVDSGEADHLVAERVWKEMSRALAEQSPHIFIQVLRDCGALARIMPEIDHLFGVPQPKRYHPEIDCGVHVLLVLKASAEISSNVDVRFACLLHDLGKATTPSEILPGHKDHERRGLPLIEQLCQRLTVPKDPKDLALKVAEFHTCVHRIRDLDGSSRYRILKSIDAFRRPEKFEQLLLACTADARGRTGFENSDYPQADIFRSSLHACNSIAVADIVAKGFKGKDIGNELDRRRIEAIDTLILEQQKIKHSKANAEAPHDS